MVDRVILVHRSRGRIVDGIRDHGSRLARELSNRGITVEQRCEFGESFVSDARAWFGLWRRLLRANRNSTVLVQYSPFCFARWGFAPWLPVMLLILRAFPQRPGVALMVHEAYVPMDSLRWVLMGLWQRLQFAAMRVAADVVFTSIDPWVRKFAAGYPKRPVHHLPVGSNFPDSREHREAERRRLGVNPATLVLGTLARDHRSWLGKYVVAAVNEISASGASVRLLVLGADAPAISGLDPQVDVEKPGFLEDSEFAARLAMVDLFLAPLEDGLSTRRGSLMVALQHGLPVIGTVGVSTDALLQEAGDALRMTPAGDPQEFATAAASLAADSEARTEMGLVARSLYERNFDWPVVADRMLATLPAR